MSEHLSVSTLTLEVGENWRLANKVEEFHFSSNPPGMNGCGDFAGFFPPCLHLALSIPGRMTTSFPQRAVRPSGTASHSRSIQRSPVDGIEPLAVVPIEVVDKERAPGLSLGC
jgi:hypothetical protein